MVPKAASIADQATSEAALFQPDVFLADRRLPEAVQLLFGLLQRIAMTESENNNGIATVLAIQLVDAARLQKPVGLPQGQSQREARR